MLNRSYLTGNILFLGYCRSCYVVASSAFAKPKRICGLIDQAMGECSSCVSTLDYRVFVDTNFFGVHNRQTNLVARKPARPGILFALVFAVCCTNCNAGYGVEVFACFAVYGFRFNTFFGRYCHRRSFSYTWHCFWRVSPGYLHGANDNCRHCWAPTLGRNWLISLEE
ncbi:MAG: hypothetical protein RLZZ534_277 [Actinomycetota bacterium]